MSGPELMKSYHGVKSELSSSTDKEINLLRESSFDGEQGLPEHSQLLQFNKRVIDVAIAISFFCLFGWLYVVLWFGVIATSGRPAIYSQNRLGKNGKVFKFYKFRSMVPNADLVIEAHLKADPIARQQWNDFQKLDLDPRITRFGSFLRKTSLDELPQFWNVLVGDMSIVGPRPCMTSQKDLYGSRWSYYCAVRPGITGLWQVSGRNKLSFNQRILLDVEYVRSMSIRRDFFIFIKTIWVVAIGHGSR